MEETQGETTWCEEEQQAEACIWKYVFGFTEMAVVKCAIELAIADVIESQESPMTLSELSLALACAPSPLYLMRFLMHRGIFKEELTAHGSPSYAQTTLSRRLMRYGEHSMAAFIMLNSSPMVTASLHHLSACVLANEISPFEVAHGEDAWSFLAANPAHSYLVDVGGGNGTTLHMLVKAFPWLRGINFDLPHVVSEAVEFHGVEHVGGDMFQSVPKADAVFLMCILHDWGDKECIQILKKCRGAVLEEKGKVIIVDAVIEEAKLDKLSDARLALDMAMMAHTNAGKERTLKEWEFLLGKAEFTRFTVKSINAVQSVIEAFP
ncbi:hypothetical protein FH972_005312 [Carpinus fangiana]|uniref:O-methyltransferase domain-containing protein n=1 Tax=Carpinus fangiana TaxID=176857 RepID=A0A5N6QS56_9ROSI|nr:hypothetical protein FH972_005312 [Carpinus fangiana]